MSSPSSIQKQQRRRRQSSGSSSTSPVLTSKKVEDLLLPSDARKRIKNLVINTIEEIADTLKQIPRATETETISSTSTSSKFKSSTNESRSELDAIDENPKRSTFGEKQVKKRQRIERNGLGCSNLSTSPSQASSSLCIEKSSQQCSDCGNCNAIPLPITYNVFDAQAPIYCRDRYFMCHGKNMYTREFFTANGEALKPNWKKLDQLRGWNQTPTIAPPPQNQPRQQQTTTISCSKKLNPNTVVIEDIEEDAKGVTLKFNIKMIKPGGTPKMIEFAIEMPDFEPSFVKVGQKSAFLE
uniref:Uncharacterized protein n=1 Tax=Panagrolaimus superbus TaxID=310955 RepID=A0A914YUR6_9BILA